MQIFDKNIKAIIRHKAQGTRHKLRTLLPFAFCLFTFAFSLLPNALMASDPVTVIVSLSPPYTPFLNEYGSNGVDKLQVSLIVNDSRMVNYPAKLQMLIEHLGSGIVMRTSEYAAIAPIMLTGNVTEVLNGFDLNKYFLAQNNVFTGFDQSQYIQTGRVPDGQYRIGFRIVDAQRKDVVLSNTAYTQPGWFVLNDPPQINLPRNREKVRVNDLQNVKLEWFPRHLGSLNATFATSYQIELFAIRVPGMHSNQVVMSMQPDFTDVTNRTRYFLTNDKYLLEPGVEYAFRIKALAGDDQLTLFQNNGYSEVFSFIYGSLCPETENVSAQTLGTDKVEITWDTDPLQTSFETRFRKAGKVNDKWHSRESFVGMTEIANILSSGVKYEYQVKATCTTVESEYSALDYFTMPYPPNAKFECGADDSVIVSNTIPKASLREGEMIFYGQFPIKLTKVSGSNGVFTGKGRMRIPFLANIQVNMQFNGIKVNELNEVYEGELASIYNPDSEFLIDDVTDYFAEGDQIGNIIDGVDSAAITLNFPVDNASNITVAVSGNTVMVNSGGQSISTTIENTEEGTTIRDSEGNLYAVDEKGNVTQVGKTTPESETQDATSYSFPPNDFDSEIQLSFENAGKWAFDAFDDVYAGSKFADEYETVDGRNTPWKFVPIGKPDKVSAKLTKGSIDLSKIKFKTPTGTEFYAVEKGGKLEITLIGAKQRDGYELFAVYEENDSITRTIGKVNIASYPFLERYLTIVPMQSGVVDATTIETAINTIYKPYGIRWHVTIDEVFDDRSWDEDNNGLKGTETDFYSAFTDEMRALNANYTSQRGIDDKSVYLFWFVEEAEGAKNMLGDMPLESRFGYIFSTTITDKTHQTIAHELAHGVFQLHHTFSDKYQIDKNTTNNLMDYKGGIELTKYQWDLIHDPQTMLFAWAQEEEEGAYTWTPVDKQHALLFNHVYDNNHIGSMHYLKAIENAIAKGNDDTLSLAYTEDEAEKWTNEQKQWIDGWKIRAMNSDEVFTDIIKSIKETGKDEKIEKIVLRPKHIYIGKYKYEDVEYPVAIYGNGEQTVMTKAFTKIQVTDAKELEDKDKKEHIYCDETYTKYLIIAFYEDEKDDPSMIMQVEKFDISQMQNTKEKWLEYLGILGEPVKYEITQSQLEEIFPNTDTTRLKEVMEAINNNCGDFNINTTQRMSHFLGQIGTETGGMKALNENECYSEASIKSVFGKVKRNGNRKYCDLFEGYNGTSLSTCPGNTLCECNPVLPDSISLDSLTVKNKYICKSALFDYTYACRMGNGAPSTKDGSKFKGKGFIQLTGKNKYKQISDEWNKMYPDDPKEFHGKDIDLLTTDIEIAMKASMVCWKIQDLNDWADVGMTDKAIDKVGSIVNGSGSNKPNGYDHRRSYTKKANEVLSK